MILILSQILSEYEEYFHFLNVDYIFIIQSKKNGTYITRSVENSIVSLISFHQMLNNRDRKIAYLCQVSIDNKKEKQTTKNQEEGRIRINIHKKR
jgi:hypothetical protein